MSSLHIAKAPCLSGWQMHKRVVPVDWVPSTPRYSAGFCASIQDFLDGINDALYVAVRDFVEDGLAGRVAGFPEQSLALMVRVDMLKKGGVS